tara:strand:- start:3643 stop:4329 length:687 start_codon:yes stop_codon:yes gene_type:complete
MSLKEVSEKRIMVIDNNLSRNLAILMERNQITESDLARALDLPYNTVKRLISGVTTDPRVSTLSLITQYFNVSLDALLSDGDPTKVSVRNNDRTPRSIPILSWEDISNRNFLEVLDLKNWEFWQPIALASTDNLSEIAYALESRPSMQSRFPIGTVFVIDPKEKPIDGDLVLIRFKDNDSVSLRDLIIDSPHWQLLSIAHNTPSINYDVKEHEIIGIVVLTILKARKS